jgi:predicted nucleotidyltransferase
MKNISLNEHDTFKNCGGVLLAELIGGSTLYGLNTKESDVDYRGLFLATDKKYTAGFELIESIVQTGDIDSSYYELLRYLKLLRKSNTQVLEILFAPDDAFTLTTDIFKEIRENRFSLIDSNVLKHSLKGYVFSEMRLATGERTGQLGGKRKAALEKYGFSYKNFIQILRLCVVGIKFFNEGEYMVRVKDHDEDFHNQLMEIKTQPENFTLDQLKKMVEEKYKELEESMEKSAINFKFDVDLASDLMLKARAEYKI